MLIALQEIDCAKCASFKSINRSYKVALVRLDLRNNQFDQAIFYKIKRQGAELSKKVNPNQANNSTEPRDKKRLLINATAGILAEYVWKLFLNSFHHPNNFVEVPEPIDVRNQIDLNTVGKNKKLEIRSSFVKNGIKFALCHESQYFDVIGPYHNSYKPNEPQKDFYLRTLFPFESDIFFQQQQMDIYLTGGATWEMMCDENLYKIKDCKPEDVFFSVKSSYRVIPMEKSLDIEELFKELEK